jgi:hypothetical protein
MKVAAPTRPSKRAIALPLGALLAAALAACGGGADSAAPQGANATVAGVVSSDGILDRTVRLTDSSEPVRQRTGTVDESGAFSVDVSGLTAPYQLEGRSTASGGQAVRLASVAAGPGWANINPITDVAVTGASAADAAAASSGQIIRGRAERFATLVAQLQSQLKPLLDAYEVPADPYTAQAPDPALRSMLAEVRFEVSMGNLLVANRATGAAIFTGPLADLGSGTFTAGSIPRGGTPPSGPPALDGAALYAAKCAGCHNPLATSTRRGRTAAQITAMHGSMVTAAEAEAIASALAVSPPAGGTTCTAFTYSAWGACQADGTQARTVTSSSPAGCTGGVAVLSQSCTPSGSPPTLDGAALYAAKCAGCHNPLATSTRLGRTAAQITAMHGSMVTAAEAEAIASALAVAPPAACTSFTYSAWGACQSSGTQSRTVATSTPYGCSGGAAPVLTQSCTYVPPTTTCTSFTYSAWDACKSDGTQTRTVTASSPTGCGGGSPILTQPCTYVPPALDGAALYASKCASCHNPLATSTRIGRTAAQILSQHPTLVTAAEADAIAKALAPAACTSFTYSAWGACQSNGTQSRTVATSTPSVCSGGTAPVLSQSCTYVPPTTTCTSFTYSAWGACQSTGTQTRTIASSSPAGCGGGSPVLTQPCTYVPPPTTSCGSCHAIPPSTGKHSKHASRSCSTCHGTGYSSTTVSSATHNDGVKNVATTIGWNATSRSCSNSCHGTKSW